LQNDHDRPHVHIVDDDESFLGFAVKTFASAAEFLTQRRGEEPGCVLTDVRMPGSRSPSSPD
jgi:FixJ family two-component response regulator